MFVWSFECLDYGLFNFLFSDFNHSPHGSTTQLFKVLTDIHSRATGMRLDSVWNQTKKRAVVFLSQESLREQDTAGSLKNLLNWFFALKYLPNASKYAWKHSASPMFHSVSPVLPNVGSALCWGRLQASFVPYWCDLLRGEQPTLDSLKVHCRAVSICPHDFLAMEQHAVVQYFITDIL